MCGICGKLNFAENAPVEVHLVEAMLDTIRHRGPDDEGVYTGPGIGLGHRRLSIIDLKSGHQPLSNEDGTVWIVFNGEIYNYRELRATLVSHGHQFRTASDTEVIVHLYEELGPACVEKLRGMFAFAIWDQKTKTFLLARDRVGIKPLYYHSSGKSLVFASEIKAILADPSVPREIATENIDRFLTFHYLPGEETLLKGINKLAPGCYLKIQNGRMETRQYWDLDFTTTRYGLSVDQAGKELEDLLADSVESHMIADVPVGVLLSGGVDSTAVLSFVVEKTGATVNTYTVGFSDPGIADERPYARLAADLFGARHHEMTITAADFSDFLPKYVWHMEEPVCEPPAIAMYYVSRLARQDVKVLLSGEGGDEGFAGYSNYRNLVWLERLKRALPPLNRAAGATLGMATSLLRAPRLAKYAPLMGAAFPGYYYSRTSDPYHAGASQLGRLYSADFGGSIDRERSLAPVRRLQDKVVGQNALNAMLYIDTKTWLPDDLLIKADKMTMANSLELRVPLLDHRVLEFAASLPPHFKLKDVRTKYIFKRALARRIPTAIRKRKKAGFPVPYNSWLRNELKDMVWGVLTDRRTLNRGYFDKRSIEATLGENARDGGHPAEIFSLLTLELWHRTFLEGSDTVSAPASGTAIPRTAGIN